MNFTDSTFLQISGALDAIRNARANYISWLRNTFDGALFHAPFTGANCSGDHAASCNGVLGILSDVGGEDINVRMLWKGMFVEISWQKQCDMSSYFHVKLFPTFKFNEVVDEFSLDNPERLKDAVAEHIEKASGNRPAKKFFVRQKNEKGEYEDLGILTLSEAVKAEFETKRAIMITPVRP
jgi:hypothetical protein